ncbi:MAG: VOC family protein [Gemmatimonadaceae bacterium]|nr:VOC family protein [Gemmatimonadaceae bacterium]
MTGIGGVFFRARDPKALAQWYRDVLGVPVEGEATYGTFAPGSDGRDAAGSTLVTVWSTFAADTTYFGAGAQQAMINYRVANLDAMLAQLRAAGAQVDERVEAYDYGRFGWAHDPEGNRFELWEPPAGEAPHG